MRNSRAHSHGFLKCIHGVEERREEEGGGHTYSNTRTHTKRREAEGKGERGAHEPNEVIHTHGEEEEGTHMEREEGPERRRSTNGEDV